MLGRDPALNWFILNYILIVPSMNSISDSNFHFSRLCWDTVDMSVSLPTEKILTSNSLLILSYRGKSLQSISLCSYWTRPYFLPWTCTNVIHNNMLHVYHSPDLLFLSFHLSLLAKHQLQRLYQLQQSPVPL